VDEVEKVRNATTIQSEILKRKAHLEDLSVNGSTGLLLRLILWKEDVRLRSGFVCIEIGTHVGLL
jgi:hypothetical protein